MTRGVRRILAVMGVLSIGLAVAAAWFLAQAMPIGTGYVAKYLCTSTFLSKRDPQAVFVEDIKPVNPLAELVAWDIDRVGQSVTATAFKVFRSKAIFRQGCGCTLLAGTTEASLREQTFFRAGAGALPPSTAPDLPWPEGSGGAVDPASLGVDSKQLMQALDDAFAEPGTDTLRQTRAVAVVYEGRLIAERYTRGFGPDMPLLGWSMSKSVTNALVGVLVRQGRLALKDPAPVAEWQSPDDPRRKITLDQLMRMSSGLAFEEVYKPLTDATDMLYGSDDFAAFAAGRPLAVEPDEKWHYSSGTANIIARIVRHEAEKEVVDYYRFINESLFNRLGMASAIIEPDPSGTFVGSSYTVATVRDWARFGLLYLQDGVWGGRRILPEGGVEYTTTPTPMAPKGEYGALFWLNAGAPGNPGDRLWPHAPLDAYAAQGFQEQKVIVIPSKKLVLVRFGATAPRSAWDTDTFIAEVIRSLPR
ncbi:MAG: serine hydrolase [Desulfobacteraceae bacterium]|jgi:CubicO group peptidase (beta-lactamase class C family)|nr:serine hydrolase [Desulfobacteraceae bacterium]